MDQSEIARLDICCLTDLEAPRRTVLLISDVTNIGRLRDGEPGVHLEGASISRKHACVRRERSGEEIAYRLENCRGRGGVRIYEKLLLPGEQTTLCHAYVFQIPGVLAASEQPHYSITFRIDDNQTTYLAFEFCPPGIIRIFGQIMHFPPREYALLAYLYDHKNKLCYYADVMGALWALSPNTPRGTQENVDLLYASPDLFSEKREALDILLVKVRSKIKLASGGVVLIETIRGEGLCLRV